MRLNRILIFLLLTGYLFSPYYCFGQLQQTNIYGYVEDSLSGERLIGATIVVPLRESLVQTTTNNFGYFSINIPNDENYTINCSYVGYETKSVVIPSSQKSKALFIKLVSNIAQEDEVIVTSNENRIATNNIGQLKLTGNLIKKMPKFLGDNDPLKVMQTLPGISQGMEGTTGLIVRGGSPDQTLFLLDGVSVYNPAHLGGLFSPFNGDAIKDVGIYKGNFPARFGERLSSVIDLSTKDGNMKKITGEGTVGMLASKFMLEGPLLKDKSSLMISARRTYWDLLASPIIALTNTSEEKRNLNLYFYDINIKFNYIFSARDRLFASFFTSNDNYRFKTISEFNKINYKEENIAGMAWHNLTGSVRWNHIISPQLFANTTLYTTTYRINTQYHNNALDNKIRTIEDGQYNSRIKEIGVKSDFEYSVNNFNALRFGVTAAHKQFQPGYSYRTTTVEGVVKQSVSTSNGAQNSPEIALYAEDNLTFSGKLNLNLGLRASMFGASKQWYNSLEPRIAINYTPIGNVRISFAYSKMNQYIHLLANNSVSLPTDIWVPATNKIKPILSNQYSLGINTSLADNDFDIGVEGYFKTINGVAEYKDGYSYLSSAVDNWEQMVETGKGKAYGLEVFSQKKYGRSTGWVSYSYGRSLRKFSTINNGMEFPFKYDRPHTISLVYMYRFNQHWRFSANWVFQSGSPFTLSTSKYEIINPEPNPYAPTISGDYISGRNAFRLLDYHRLDIGFTWSKKKKYWEKYWDFSFYNLYNRKNPVFYTYGYNLMTNRNTLKGIGVFPILPSISYGLKF